MLTILLTNIALANRSGTEVVTEQLADGLRRRGHRVAIFTQKKGALAEQMCARGHIVVDRPGALLWRPDVIHGHHTAPTMAALAAHPGVPALFVCHDATAPFDAAPMHPRVRRVFAVDERCRARLVADGASPHDVSLLPNAVDLHRVPPRSTQLPARPQRAIVSTRSNHHLPVLREVCGQFGITLDELGHGPGRITETIEESFAGTDLVFATARTALEAAASGAGVIVCDERGCAGFLTRERAAAWLPWNFGAGILSKPTSAASIAEAIAEWSPSEAADASALVRAERSLESTLDQLDLIYRDILGDPVLIETAAEAAAVSAFISGWVPNFDLQAPWLPLAEAVSPMRMGPVAPLTSQTAALREQTEALGERLVDDVKNQGVPSLERGPVKLSAQVGALAAHEQPGVQQRLRSVWRSVVPHAIRVLLYDIRHGRRS